MIGPVIDKVLDGIQFTVPIELADMLETHRRIVVAFDGKPPRLECYHKIRCVVVEAREGDRVVYHREVPVS